MGLARTARDVWRDLGHRQERPDAAADLQVGRVERVAADHAGRQELVDVIEPPGQQPQLALHALVVRANL
jgi:hypothetical protein